MVIYTSISKKFRAVALASVLLTLIAGCGSSASDDKAVIEPPPPPAPTGVLSGRVHIEQGLVGAKISVNGSSVMTDSNGLFELKGLAISDDKRWLVTISKEGYIATQKIVNLASDQQKYLVDIILTKPDIIRLVDLTQAQTITLNQDQLTIKIAANAISGGGKKSSVSLTYGDPSSDRGLAIFPGDFSATNDIDKTPSILLESIGFMDISVTDSEGNDLTTLTAPADVSLRLPAIYQSGGSQSDRFKAGDTIAWWSYNDQEGTWLREDAIASTSELDDALITSVNGMLFANAQVTHFSWWNVDQPITEHACITVQLLDSNDLPVSGLEVMAQGFTYQSTLSGLTDEQGYASITVKRTLDSNAPEQFKLFARKGNSKIFYQVSSEREGTVDTTLLTSPTTQGSTINSNSGQCIELEHPLKLTFAGKVTGVLKNTSGIIMVNTAVYNSISGFVMTDNLGQFSFDVPLSTSFYVIVETYSQSFSLTKEQPTLELNINLVNHAPAVSEISAPSDSDYSSGSTIALSVNVSDPENDTLSYLWSVDAGTILSQTSATPSWVMPSQANGSAEVTVIVSDQMGNKVTKTRSFSWSSGGTPSDFIVKAVLSSFVTSGKVDGITIILHGVDGRSIERVIETDNNGIANFGLIDRERVTVTIAETIMLLNQKYLNLTTQVNVKQQAMTYTVDFSSALATRYFCDADELITVKAKFINIPDAVDMITIENNYNGQITPIEGEEVDLRFCVNYINDEKFNIVAKGMTFSGDESASGSALIAHSQAVLAQLSTEALVFDMSKSPIDIPYVNNTAMSVEFTAFDLADYFLPLVAIEEQQSTNVVSVYDIDTGDDLLYYSLENQVSANSSVYYGESWTQNSMPANITFNIPEFSATNFSYDTVINKYSWQLIGGQAVDTISIVKTNRRFNWNVLMANSAGSYVMPMLPQALMTVINEEESFNSTLALLDIKTMTGFDQVITLSNHGLFPWTSAGQGTRTVSHPLTYLVD